MYFLSERDKPVLVTSLSFIFSGTPVYTALIQLVCLILICPLTTSLGATCSFKTWKWKCLSLLLCPTLCNPMCPTLCNPMNCSPPGSSVYGISQATILEWVAFSSSRGSSRPRDWIYISWGSCIADGFFTIEQPEKSILVNISTQCLILNQYNTQYLIPGQY